VKQLNYGKIFSLTTKMCRLAISSQRTRGLVPVLLNRVIRLINTLFSGGKSSRFIYRLDIPTLATLVNLWYTVCAPWKILGDSMEKHKEFIVANSEIYASIVPLLQSIPIQDFVADFHHAKNQGEGEFKKFLAHKDTKIGIDILVKVFEVIGPVKDGLCVIDMVSPSAGIAKSGDATVAFCQLVQDMWNVARQCTWHDGYVPKQLSDESWRMDALVKVGKHVRGRKSFWSIFVWEESETKSEDTIDIPKKRQVAPPTRRLERRTSTVTVVPEMTWNSASCSNEIEFVVRLLKRIIEKYSQIDLSTNPKKYSFARKFADVTVLLILSFSLWMYISIAWCPWIKSGSVIALIQIFFLVIVGLLSLKFIGSQYVV